MVTMRFFVFVLMALAGATPLSAEELDPTTERFLRAAIASQWRSPRAVARDPYRHPYETLKFFGLSHDMRVMEVTPGNPGYYRQILEPVVTGLGGYYAYYPGRSRLPREPMDMILTFRNVHNWTGGSAESIFRSFFAVLKPGGTLGLVEHRLPEDAGSDMRGGYVKESVTIALAEAAGFQLVARSDINANPKDDHDHPKGVWTLPPNLALGATDREIYLAIGESDRYTLKFIKPGG